MFPNDDICNIRAAKCAAKRIFEKYTLSPQQQTQSKGLGRQEVSGLIKNAYSAINMAYDPSINDICSFMSVFGVGQEIQLYKLEELAVKYLCGEDLLKVQDGIDVSCRSAKVTEPKSYFLSQPSLISKQNTTTPTKSSKQEEGKTIKKLTYSQILNQANSIFNQHKNRNKEGITTSQASQVLRKTYGLIGKTKFKPSEDDVKIWMKLCDYKKTGIVQWGSYQNFVKRMMERQKIVERNQK